MKCCLLLTFATLLFLTTVMGCMGGVEIRPQGADLNPKLEKLFEESVVQIVFYDGERPVTSCSGIFLSHSGFLLTVKHCVDTLATFKPNNIEKNDPEDWASYYLKQKVTFRIRYNYDDFFSRLQVGPIVATGAERIYTENKTTQRLADLTDSGQGLQADWLIVQLGKTNNPCLSAAPERAFSEGAEVFHLGFPTAEGKDVNHLKLVAAKGKIDSEILNRLVKSMIALVDQKLDQLQSKVIATKKFSIKQTTSFLAAIAKARKENKELAPKILTTGILATDAAVEKGMSGGATVSPEGNLVGINMLKDIRGSESSPTSAFLPVTFIKRSIETQRKKYPDIPTPETIFNCSQ